MKWTKIFAQIAVIMMFAFLAVVNVHAKDPYDNKAAIYAYTDKGTSFISVRNLANELNLSLAFDNKNKRITLANEKEKVVLYINSNRLEVNGKTKSFKEKSWLMNGALYVPAKDILKAFDLDYTIENNSNLVILDGERKILVHLKPITSAYLYNPKEVKVIMYHHFDENTSNAITLTPETLHEQLDALIKAGFETITDEDFLKFKQNPSYKLPNKPLLITIDDGYTSNYEIAYPILKEKGLRATIYVITSYRGETPGFIPHFDWDKAREMYESGVINIESHTHDLHYKVPTTFREVSAILYKKPGESKTDYRARIKEDLVTSKKLIEENLGKKSITISYPYGSYNKEVAKIAKEAGYKLQVTLRTDRNRRDGSPFINRINAHGEYSGEELLRKLN